MLFLADFCYLLAVITFFSRVDYTPSLCFRGGSALTESHYGSSPSFALSVSHFGFSPSYALSVARVGFTPSLELSTSRVGVYCLGYGCCDERVELLSLPLSSSMLLNHRAHLLADVWVSLFACLCALLCCFLRVLFFARLYVCCSVRHCFSGIVSWLCALPSAGLRAFMNAGSLRAPLFRGLCAFFYYCLCACFLLVCSVVFLVGGCTLAFGYLTGFICICLIPLCFLATYSSLTVGYFAYRGYLMVGRWVSAALGIVAWYFLGFTVPFLVGVSVILYVCGDRCFVSRSFDLKEYVHSLGLEYLSLDELLDHFADIKWSPIFSFGFTYLFLSFALFKSLVVSGLSTTVFLFWLRSLIASSSPTFF